MQAPLKFHDLASPVLQKIYIHITDIQDDKQIKVVIKGRVVGLEGSHANSLTARGENMHVDVTTFMLRTWKIYIISFPDFSF